MRLFSASLLALGVVGCVGTEVRQEIPREKQELRAAADPPPPPVAEAARPVQQRIYPLSELQTVPVAIGTHRFRAWLMDNRAKRMEGFMFVKPGDFKSDQGMLFVFPEARKQGFWMQNVSFDLDIAYIASDRKIVSVHTMKAMDTNPTPSAAPAQFALELKAGTFKRLGIKAGMRVDFPKAARAIE